MSALSGIDRPARDAPANPGRLLHQFFLYRLLVACALIGLFYAPFGPAFLGSLHPDLYAVTAILYLGLVIASGLFLYLRSDLSKRNLAFLMVFVDIAALVPLIHASGGVSSGLGMLLAVSITAGSLIIQGRTAMLAAALASLAVLTEQLYSQWFSQSVEVNYSQAGLLGVSYFAIALLAQVLTQRLQESEKRVSQRELDLANLAQLNEYVIQHIQTGILVVDNDRAIRLFNAAAWQLLGMPEIRTGAPLEQASPNLDTMLRCWLDDPNLELETFRPRPGGRELKASFTNLGQDRRTGAVLFLEDAASVTAQAQQIKLASLGRLTASIAHEIRNPLGAISHAQQLLRESPDLNPADRRLVEIIHSNTHRVNGIIESVMQLSRRDRSKPEEFNLLQWLTPLADEFRTRKGLSADNLTLQIEPQETRVFVDPGQLWQVVSNLCENAVHHFDRELSELRLRLNGGITRESGGPFLDITDNGPGIPPALARQIFEPFFTTENSGTGLGLYIARELSESNRLRLEYIPVPTGGCCFRISFPSIQSDLL